MTKTKTPSTSTAPIPQRSSSSSTTHTFELEHIRAGEKGVDNHVVPVSLRLSNISQQSHPVSMSPTLSPVPAVNADTNISTSAPRNTNSSTNTTTTATTTDRHPPTHLPSSHNLTSDGPSSLRSNWPLFKTTTRRILTFLGLTISLLMTWWTYASLQAAQKANELAELANLLAFRAECRDLMQNGGGVAKAQVGEECEEALRVRILLDIGKDRDRDGENSKKDNDGSGQVKVKRGRNGKFRLLREEEDEYIRALTEIEHEVARSGISKQGDATIVYGGLEEAIGTRYYIYTPGDIARRHPKISLRSSIMGWSDGLFSTWGSAYHESSGDHHFYDYDRQPWNIIDLANRSGLPVQRWLDGLGLIQDGEGQSLDAQMLVDKGKHFLWVLPVLFMLWTDWKRGKVKKEGLKKGAKRREKRREMEGVKEKESKEESSLEKEKNN